VRPLAPAGATGRRQLSCHAHRARRATAQNVLFNLGRAVGGFGPLVIGALAATYSWQVAIALLAAI
jgi:hypothetical protein